jgi:hypothetical protein
VCVDISSYKEQSTNKIYDMKKITRPTSWARENWLDLLPWKKIHEVMEPNSSCIYG